MIGWIQMYQIHPLVYHPYEYLGEGYVSYITILSGNLSIFIMDMVYPVHFVNPHLLDISDFINSGWESITELKIPTCEFFHGLMFFL